MADTAIVADQGQVAGDSPPGGLVAPMLATAGPIPTGLGWIFEIKFDGVRAVGYAVTGGGLRLFSRNNRDVTGPYPNPRELHQAGEKLARRLVGGLSEWVVSSC